MVPAGSEPIDQIIKDESSQAKMVILAARLVVTWKQHLYAMTYQLAASITSMWALSMHATSTQRIANSSTVWTWQ